MRLKYFFFSGPGELETGLFQKPDTTVGLSVIKMLQFTRPKAAL